MAQCLGNLQSHRQKREIYKSYLLPNAGIRKVSEAIRVAITTPNVMKFFTDVLTCLLMGTHPNSIKQFGKISEIYTTAQPRSCQKPDQKFCW